MSCPWPQARRMDGHLRAWDQDRAPGPETSPETAATRVTGVTQGSRLRHFLVTAFVVVVFCFGFKPFLSFFCELLPLPMFTLLMVGVRKWPPASHTALLIGIFSGFDQSISLGFASQPCFCSFSP